MNTRLALSLAAAFSLGMAATAATVLGPRAFMLGPQAFIANRDTPVWHEVAWPFPMDQWGKGRAFECRAADCGSNVTLYLRPKLGACNCTRGVADDDELDRMGDLDLVGKTAPLAAGRPVTIGWMQGRARAYLSLAAKGHSIISVAFNDRCDMMAATAVVAQNRHRAVEPGVIAFLNSKPVLDWTSVSLGI